MFGAIVQNGKLATCAALVAVNALKRVDFPTFGSPTMPDLNPTGVDAPVPSPARIYATGRMRVKAAHEEPGRKRMRGTPWGVLPIRGPARAARNAFAAGSPIKFAMTH